MEKDWPCVRTACWTDHEIPFIRIDETQITLYSGYSHVSGQLAGRITIKALENRMQNTNIPKFHLDH